MINGGHVLSALMSILLTEELNVRVNDGHETEAPQRSLSSTQPQLY